MKTSFKQRTADFWKAFEKEEANIRELIDKEADSNTLISKMSKVLEKAFNDLPFEMGHNGEKHELILSPNGNKMVLMQIQYLLKHRPEHLNTIWNFYEAKPAMGREGMGLEIYGIRISTDDFMIYPAIDEERKLIDIEVYAPVLDKLDENSQYNALFIMLDLFIGEFYTMEYIGAIDIIDREKSDESMSIIKLRSFIDYLIAEYDWDKTENPADTWTVYEKEADEESEVLRDDVFIGYTSVFNFINSLGEDDVYPLEQFKKDGISVGYIFYNNETVAQEDMVPQRSEIEDRINEMANLQGVAQSIGGATGVRHSYIDFIIYDLDAFVDIAREVMKDYDFTPKGIAFFGKSGSPISF